MYNMGMEKFPRRNLLKMVGLGAYFPFSKILPPNLDQSVELSRIIPNTRVEIVGTQLPLTTSDDASPGDRAILFDGKFGLVGVQQGEYGECYVTNDFAQTWKKVLIPVSERDEYMDPPSPRHFIGIGGNKYICVFDYSVALLKADKDGSIDATNVYPEGLKDTRILQTACAYRFENTDSNGRKFKDTRIIVGCWDMLSGLITTTLSEIEETLEHNKNQAYSKREYPWRRLEGLTNPKRSYIRAVIHDPVSHRVIYGGWSTPYIPKFEAGT